MTEAASIEHEPWALRAVFLLALGALAGLAVHFITHKDVAWSITEDPLRLGAAAAIMVGSIAFAFSLEKLRWAWSIAFALLAGLIVGLVTCWNGAPPNWGSGEGWRFAASLLAVAIAVPLFQAVRDSGTRRLDPRVVHDHAWTNVILWFLVWAFILAAFLLILLLGGLFDLIGMDFLQRLMRKDWFASMAWGGTFGAAVGLVRDRDRVLGLLQRVGRTILSVLAPVLAAGLVFFVLALAFTGLGPLWRETAETTPILLGCMAGGIILANAVIGNSPEEEPQVRVLRWAAMALGAVLLPLAIVASISMAKRIGQYGFTPDRLWAVVVVAAAVAVSCAYLVALVRGKAGWAGLVRRYNVGLAAGICLLALFLALPIVNFGAISARDQLAMLESGRIAPDRFDWRAMRFDFGPSGRKALERLRDKGRTPDIRAHASSALRADDRWALESVDEIKRKEAAIAEVRVLPKPIALPAGLLERLPDYGGCNGGSPCFVFFEDGATNAVVVSGPVCPPESGAAIREDLCETTVSTFRLTRQGWAPGAADHPPASPGEGKADLEALLRDGPEIREVTRRQVFVRGRPVGKAFE
jgi:hypothetical protein